VFVEVEGDPAPIARFTESLRREAPPLAVIEHVHEEVVASTGDDDFAIIESRSEGDRLVPVSPDIATCASCVRDIFDPANRRYRYPFTNCTNCGPRFSIVRDVPYDRAFTTMAQFTMCSDCSREYHDPSDRRFHAQPISCPACGPQLCLVDRNWHPQAGDPIRTAAELLHAGYIIAIKGLGGYHLAAAAANQTAVAALRARKHREDKPFAVMAPDLTAARLLVELDPVEEQILTSPRRPIVLLRRRPGGPVAESVAGNNRFLGLMLPYTPVHYLLCD